jgi:hypothetical protein
MVPDNPVAVVVELVVAFVILWAFVVEILPALVAAM